MAKSKSAKAAQPSQDSQVKKLSAVEQGAVTKSSQTPKAKSKEMAKQVAVKAEQASKKSKKVVKEPSSDDSESGSSADEAVDSASSASSEDDSEDDAPAAKTNDVKTNGHVKAAANDDDESSGTSDSSDEETANPSAPKATPATKHTAAGKNESDSEDDSEEDDSEDEDEEENKGPVDATMLDGKLAKVASKEASSEEDSSSGTSDSGSGSEESSEEDSEEEAVPPPKKRKAEELSTPAVKKSKVGVSDDVAMKRNLFVGRLSWNVDEDWLTREFEKFGELTRVKVMDDGTGRSKGYGYVEFANGEEAVKAQAAMHETEIDGRSINVDFSHPKPDRSAGRQERASKYGDQEPSPESSTLFVANLSFEATNDIVAEEFGRHGSVSGVRLPTDMNSGAPKGFGYVEFPSIDEAKKVFAAMTGAAILGRPIRLDYSTPRPARDGDSRGGRGGRGGFDRGGRGGGRGRGSFDRGGRGGGRGGDRGGRGRGGSTNRGGFGDFQGKKVTLS